MPAVLERLIERPRDQHHEARRHAKAYKVLAVLSLIALVLQTGLLMTSLFEPPLPYEIGDAGSESLDSPEFLRVLSAVTGGWPSDGNAVQVLTNGDQFYPAELAAIKAARRFIHIECYIFQKGRVTDEILHALEERARAGVEVRLVIDAIGSAGYRDSRFATLRNAGGRVAWYHRGPVVQLAAREQPDASRARWWWTGPPASRAAPVLPTNGDMPSAKTRNGATR